MLRDLTQQFGVPGSPISKVRGCDSEGGDLGAMRSIKGLGVEDIGANRSNGRGQLASAHGIDDGLEEGARS